MAQASVSDTGTTTIHNPPSWQARNSHAMKWDPLNASFCTREWDLWSSHCVVRLSCGISGQKMFAGAQVVYFTHLWCHNVKTLSPDLRNRTPRPLLRHALKDTGNSVLVKPRPQRCKLTIGQVKNGAVNTGRRWWMTNDLRWSMNDKHHVSGWLKQLSFLSCRSGVSKTQTESLRNGHTLRTPIEELSM